MVSPRIKKPSYFFAQLYYRKVQTLTSLDVSFLQGCLPNRSSSSSSSFFFLFFSMLPANSRDNALGIFQNTHLFEELLAKVTISTPWATLIALAVFKSFYQNNMNVPHKGITAVKTALKKQVAPAPFKSRRIPVRTGLSHLIVPLLKLTTTTEAVKTYTLKYFCFYNIPNPVHSFL